MVHWNRNSWDTKDEIDLNVPLVDIHGIVNDHLVDGVEEVEEKNQSKDDDKTPLCSSAERILNSVER